MLTFTVTEEANHAASLRARRDLSDDDIAQDYAGSTQSGMREFVAEQRGDDAYDRRFWQSEAMRTATAQAVKAATSAGVDDLDGATVMVTLDDLVATATITVGGPI